MVEGSAAGAESGWEPSLPLRPDELLAFRIARLVLLLDVAADTRRPTVALDRLGYYDFFADAPLLVFPDSSNQRRQLTLAGFSVRNLSYSSAAQRFTNRRSRLQHDLALLVSRGLVILDRGSRRPTWGVSNDGRHAAGKLGSMYALAFRESAELVLTRLGSLSDASLERHAREWLKAEPFLIDLWGGLEAAR